MTRILPLATLCTEPSTIHEHVTSTLVSGTQDKREITIDTVNLKDSTESETVTGDWTVRLRRSLGQILNMYDTLRSMYVQYKPLTFPN